MKSIF